MSKTKGKVTLGLLFGAVAGFFAGILSAPQSGKKTRKDLKDSAVDLKKKAASTAEETVGDLKYRAVDAVDDVRDRVLDRYDDAVDAVDELKRRAGRAIDGAKKGFKDEDDEDENGKSDK